MNNNDATNLNERLHEARNLCVHDWVHQIGSKGLNKPTRFICSKCDKWSMVRYPVPAYDSDIKDAMDLIDFMREKKCLVRLEIEWFAKGWMVRAYPKAGTLYLIEDVSLPMAISLAAAKALGLEDA